MAEKKTTKKAKPEKQFFKVFLWKKNDIRDKILVEIEKLQKDSLYYSSAVKEILERLLKEGEE